MTRAEQRTVKAQQGVDAFNAENRVGALVRFWTGEREGDGMVGVTRSDAEVLSGHTGVVWIKGVSGCVALSHVQAIEDGQ
jgi:hypothetical protein